MSKPVTSSHLPADDPLALFSRVAAKLNTLWLRWTYPFVAFGKGVSIHPSCDIYRTAAPQITIGNDVFLGRDVWLNVVDLGGENNPKLVLSHGCKIGRRSTLSARNEIVVEEDVLLAPSVLIMDHNHKYSDVTMPVHGQGVTEGGRIKIEKNCWLGYGAVVVCTKGNLTIGRNSVVGAHSVVTKSIAPFSVVAGNPAKLVKQFDPSSQMWVAANPSLAKDEE
jgi:acetyltransferase-like isoleucine patch superfamily enzyme